MLPRTFCALPFHQLTIMNDGEARLCCRSDHSMMSEGHRLSLPANTLEQVWHSAYLRTVRSRMLEGTDIEGCRHCYATEASGVTSLRQTMNALYAGSLAASSEDELLRGAQAIVHARDRTAPSPSALHLWLGRLCNLKCRMCSPAFSSRIASDPVHAQWSGGPSSPAPSWSHNGPVLDQLLAHPDGLRLIQFSGGEPLLHRAFSDILRRLADAGHASHIHLYVTSNGTRYSQRMASLLTRFASVELAVSVDGLGPLHDYIRSPSRWDAIRLNILAYREQNVSLSIRPTVQSYNIFGLVDLARWCEQQGLRFVLDNVLRAPRFLSLDMLPPAVIEEALQDWEAYLDTECRGDNRWHVMSVIAALRRPRPDPDTLTVLQDEFIRFTNDLDQSRGESFAKACPRLHERLTACGVTLAGKHRFSPREPPAIDGPSERGPRAGA